MLRIQGNSLCGWGEWVLVGKAFSFLVTTRQAREIEGKTYQLREPSDKTMRATSTVCIISKLEICKAGNYKFFKDFYIAVIGLPWWLNSKESACQHRSPRFYPWLRKIPRRRKWQPTPVFLSGKSHEQRSLLGYSSWGCKESDRTEWLNNNNNMLLL